MHRDILSADQKGSIQGLALNLARMPPLFCAYICNIFAVMTGTVPERMRQVTTKELRVIQPAAPNYKPRNVLICVMQAFSVVSATRC